MGNRPQHHRTVAKNRRARFNYDISDELEAGVVLTGTEVKSLRAGQANIGDGYVVVREGEAWLHAIYIPEYTFGNRFNHDPRRPRKLLLGKVEIERLRVRIQERGCAAVPLELYFAGPWVKVRLGIGKGRKAHDKRQQHKTRYAQKEIDEAL